ncbi:MAG TPA: hypothetical protein VMT85_12080 [Thermoanaerobaculia bacterium]|nr:hypothetical protein [Thermoanaerobaculia bacterium]
MRFPRRPAGPAVTVVAMAWLSASAVAAGPSTVSGTVTIDGEELALSHAHYEEGVREMWLTVATAPADAETVYALFQEEGAGLFLALDPKTGKAAREWISRLLHSHYPPNFGGELEPEAMVVEMETLDESRAVGRISMVATEIEGHTVSFDLQVDAQRFDPCTDLGPVTVSGEPGGPLDAFRTFYEALAGCDWQALEDSMNGELLTSWKTEMAGDQKALGLFVDWAIAQMPRTAAVTEVRADGKDRATLVVRFGEGEDAATTEMVAERVSRKRWKIAASEMMQF